ncbi:hypothetical protein M011DRAFT_466132 [Sporormia fimetaria CBS 119925]|uniref:Uncharacterized protein n=1 Tax=Sporormia fimetaria CBS 119925 TaxID=1340428 RepID=A0A6A6VH22_9PLEO|nr:hypothetical protein M011DRAFT_466132 [Sporormia fimetaria CBS 119925]
MLPRIKYRNPSVSVQITRHSDPSGPSKLHIYTSSDNKTAEQPTTLAPKSATPNRRDTFTPDTTPPTYTVEIRDLHESEILAHLVSKTKAEEIEPSAEEVAEMEEIKEFKVRSAADRALVKEKFTKERREQELLRLARGEVTAAA